ncbi:hypothetical protein [Rhizobium hidalgonense]|uniref:hypothetical protein n=1 Tax=Rhizobium hidalgonense TaxID=1538159 RepID=UPI001106C69E|nr:hypothetical protein [Rhizobium hidalgonense]QKK26777.1 hypothetical protein FFM81_026005 [Rhizobium hidalgonense]
MIAVVQEIINSAVTTGPTVLMPQGLNFRRPMDVVNAPAISADDKRAILAAWASDFYALDSRPALRHIPGTPEPVSIDDVCSALEELDRRYEI